ncbi:hypothetical protein CEXT_160861 [Caerostris extrusa]|uniref:Uncharacterized protein n=1 Tax=Caerostris extrusa TaxID=172846 RepID=A0AAV4Y9D2_CAEEX|nr:hypothetical protein CEXT_160861 [Caerostris extrusa]
MKAKLFGKLARLLEELIPLSNNYTSSKSIISKPRSGRPSKLTAPGKRYVFKSVRLNLRISAFQIANDVRERDLKKHSMKAP